MELYDFYHTQIAASLQTFDTKGDPSSGKRRKNQPYIDLRRELYRISGIDFTQLPGLDALTVQTIISEVGLDAARFPGEKHFASVLTIVSRGER